MSWLIQYKLEMRRSMHQASTICTSYICVQLPYWDLSRCLLCRLCFYNPMAPVLIHMCFFNIFLQFWWYWCSLLLSWFDWWNEILDLGFAINSKSGIFGDDCLNLANAEQEQFVCVFCKNKSLWAGSVWCHWSDFLDLTVWSNCINACAWIII